MGHDSTKQGGPDPGIIVVGAHRSGTSVLTRAIADLGFDRGRGELVGSAPSNPHGHWEHRAINDLHDDLLAVLGGDWAAPHAAPDRDVRRLADGPLGDRARALIADLFPPGGWVWKDPRASVLLPFWSAVLDDRLRLVVAFRRPEAVAASLDVRDRLGHAYGAALWERHLRAILTFAPGRPTAIVAYDELVDHPAKTLDWLAAWLGRPAGPAVTESIRPDLRSAEVDMAITDEQRHLSAALAELAGAHDRLAAVELGSETPNLQLAFEAHHRMKAHADREQQLYGYAQNLEARVEELDELVADREATIDTLARDVMELRDYHAEVERVTAEREERLTDLNQRLLVRIDGYLRRRLRR